MENSWNFLIKNASGSDSFKVSDDLYNDDFVFKNDLSASRSDDFNHYHLTENIVGIQNGHPAHFFRSLCYAWSDGLIPLLLPFGSKNDEITKIKEDLPTHLEQKDLQSMALIVLSSGSTGKASLNIFSMDNLISSAKSVSSYFNLNKNSSWGLTLPGNHMAGFMVFFRSLICGAKVQPFSYKNDLLPQNITHLSLVPAQLAYLLERKKGIHFLQNVDHILIGGSALSSHLYKKAKIKEINLTLSYGLTEMASTVAIFSSTNPYGHFYKPLKHINIGQNKNGELTLTGPSKRMGTFKNKKFIKENEGSFCTKDLVQIEDGSFKVLGRSDGAFISGGENIDPLEIENALLGLDGVLQVRIVPIKHKKLGAVGCAFINSDLSKEDILKKLSLILHPFKLPKEILPYPNSKNGIKPSLLDFKAALNNKGFDLAK